MLVDTVQATGTTSLIIGSATAISYIVDREQIATKLGDFILSMTSNPYIFLFIINIALLVLGMFIDTSVIQVVFIPIMLPLVSQLGIDLVHFGIVVVFNMTVGLSTPPFGMLLSSRLSGTPLRHVVKEIMPAWL